jgi:hypothetical protein
MDEKYVREELRDNGYNVSKLARSLGMDYVETKLKYGNDETPARRPAGPRPVNIKDLARTPPLRRHVIAVKPANGEWPNDYSQVIHTARKRVDAGTHTMCQNTREDGWVVLYLIPLKRPQKPKPFFFMPIEGVL